MMKLEMDQKMNLTQDTNTKTEVNSKAKLKLKELGEFQDVLKKTFDSFLWAQDFTTFPQIQEWSEKVLEVIDEVQDEVGSEVDYLDYQLSEYDFQLTLFEKEHEVEVD
jgi:hypothetical protein